MAFTLPSTSFMPSPYHKATPSRKYVFLSSFALVPAKSASAFKSRLKTVRVAPGRHHKRKGVVASILNQPSSSAQLQVKVEG